MTVVAFVLMTGLAVGALAYQRGLVVGVTGVFIGAVVAALMDVAGIRWRTWLLSERAVFR